MERPTLAKYLFWRKDSPSIWYRFTVDGVAYTASTETSDPKLAEMIMTTDRAAALGGKVRLKETTIGISELAKQYLEGCRKQPSYGTKEDGVRNFITSPRIKGKKAKDVTRDDVKWYQVWRQDYVKQSTINRELGNIRNMYNVAINDMRLSLTNPAAGVKFFSERKFQRDRFMKSEEKETFFADTKTPWRCKDVVFFAIKTGLRQGELRDLLVTDLDFTNQLIKVRAGEEDKTRFVPMFPELVQPLQKWAKEAKALNSRWAFHNDNGTKLSRYGWLTTSFNAACRRNNIENLTFHDLRHTFASDFVMAGGDFVTLGQYMGHTTTHMTTRYAHLTPKYKASQILLLPREKAYLNALANYDTTTLAVSKSA